MIKPTHTPGTLDSTFKDVAAVAANTDGSDNNVTNTAGPSLKDVQSHGATLAKIVNTTGVQLAGENENAALSVDIGTVNAPVITKHASSPAGPSALAVPAVKESGLKERRSRGRPKASATTAKRNNNKIDDEAVDPLAKASMSQ